MESTPEVVTFLSLLEARQCAWLDQPVAMPDSGRGSPVSTVHSWDDAIDAALSEESEAFLLDSMNALYGEIARAGGRGDRTRTRAQLRQADAANRAFSSWVRKIHHGKLEKIVAQSVKQIPREVPPDVGNHLQWLLAKSCVALQFRSVLREHDAYLTIGRYIANGWFVCGYKGTYPSGQLVALNLHPNTRR